MDPHPAPKNIINRTKFWFRFFFKLFVIICCKQCLCARACEASSDQWIAGWSLSYTHTRKEKERGGRKRTLFNPCCCQNKHCGFESSQFLAPFNGWHKTPLDLRHTHLPWLVPDAQSAADGVVIPLKLRLPSGRRPHHGDTWLKWERKRESIGTFRDITSST